LTQFLDDCWPAVTKTITVLAPSNTGISWYNGSQEYIFWTYSGLPTGTNVKIDLLKGEVYQYTIAQSVPVQQQSYRWAFIPDLQTPGTDYKIKISTIDNAVSGTSKNNFEIKAKGAVGNLQVTCPTVTGATITVDGGLTDQNQIPPFVLPATPWLTNKLFSKMRNGDYLVTVTPASNSGYQEMTKMVNVRPGFTSTGLFPLTTVSGKNEPTYPILVVSTPQEAQYAQIWIGPNGGLIEKVEGATTEETGAYIAMPAGAWDIYVTKDGWKTSGIQTVTVGPDYPEAEVTFTLTALNPVPAQGLILPQPLNIGRDGYFVAFVALQGNYKAADVKEGSVSCNGVPALKLVKSKYFPNVFAAIFSRQGQRGIITPNGKDPVPMKVVGAINKVGGNPLFTVINNIKVISKPDTTKDPINDVMTLRDDDVFTKFYKP
jgi:hypothetical protein